MAKDSPDKLARMRRLLDKLGHPEKAFKICHVAGSKGKGSTARMLAEILAAETGRAVGVYASPHVTDPRERISSTAGFFDDSIYERARVRVDAAAAGESLGWFERMTAEAFCCFAEMELDWVVVETGIGGRLDSTNVIEKPEICLITAMELTHCAKLGYTIEEIAREKGGIIKPGVPVVLAKQRYAAAAEVIAAIAEAVGAPLYHSDDDLPEKYQVRMRGQVQRENAATASLAARLLGASEAAIIAGLERAWLPGRFEMRPLGDALLVLDGAHTVESWRALMRSFAELGDGEAAGRPRYLLAKFKGSEDELRAIREIVMNEQFDKIWELTADPAEREAIIIDALETARRDGALLLITGSFYLLGDVEGILSRGD